MFRLQVEGASRNPILVSSIENLTSHNTLPDQFTDKRVSNLTQSHSHYNVVESTPTTLAGGNPAHKIVFTGTSIFDKQTIKGLEIWTLKDDKAYVITSFAEPDEYHKHLPAIQSMVDSFKIMK
jgi:serine/threonine-protein kinase